MRILMLGWEYPPHTVGGLGVACVGLARALERLGHRVTFVVPRPVDETTACEGAGAIAGAERRGRASVVAGLALPDPYSGDSICYGGDLLARSEAYAGTVEARAAGESFDVIHAHDWPTYAAGAALSRRHGRPLVAHVHSTETERAGAAASPRIAAAERAGLHAAARVIAVSGATRDVCVREYGVPAEKIAVVHNGTDEAGARPSRAPRRGRERTVLFLGRITAQKGPERLLAAAELALGADPALKFIVAGWGDLAERTVERAAELGIGHRVLFAGDLGREDVRRVLALADCLVMPSVAEPFGLAALEAAAHGVPVIVSRGAGVAEAVRGVVQVDSSDAGALAGAILEVVRRPALAGRLRRAAAEDARGLTWARAAARCVEVYRAAGAGGAEPVVTRRRS